ncbi:MAG: hypothetical protein KJP00_02035 [Bacteroidia bacterium]|nr:hypothetical protein [Bacteroidia bacterium]
MLRPILSSAILLSLIILIAGCTDEGDIVHVDKQEFSLDDQLILGDYVADYISGDPLNFPLVNANAHPQVYDYLNSIFRSVVLTEQIQTRNKFRWEIFPIEDDNSALAYTAPGGKFFITTGMLQFLETESELMSIMASEIYYTDRDYLTSMIKDEYGGVMMGDIIFGYEVPEIKDIALFLKDAAFSPEVVSQADKTALEILCPFNYDMESLGRLIERSYKNKEQVQWIQKRKRADTWPTILRAKVSDCPSSSGQRFRARYQEFKSLLP